jgi:hypothetical protein
MINKANDVYGLRAWKNEESSLFNKYGTLFACEAYFSNSFLNDVSEVLIR